MNSPRTEGTRADILRRAAALVALRRCNHSCIAISKVAGYEGKYEDLRSWYRELFEFAEAPCPDPTDPLAPWDQFTRAIRAEPNARGLRVMLLCFAAEVAENP